MDVFLKSLWTFGSIMGLSAFIGMVILLITKQDKFGNESKAANPTPKPEPRFCQWLTKVVERDTNFTIKLVQTSCGEEFRTSTILSHCHYCHLPIQEIKCED